MPLFDEKQILTDMQTGKLTTLDFLYLFIKDEKAEAKNAATLSGGSYSVNALTVLPDGRLASGSFDTTIKLWDIESGTCAATLSGHSYYVDALTVLPDGRLASGSSDKTIKLWDIRTGACTTTFSGHSDYVV